MRADTYVYFIRAQDGTGPIKIGCSRVPAGRLKDLMNWSPVPLALLHKMPGDAKLESALHNHFDRAHSHGEWFHPDPELLALITKLKSGAKLEDVVTLTGGPWAKRQGRRCTPEHKRYMSYAMRFSWAQKRVSKKRGVRFVYKPADCEQVLRTWLGNKTLGKPEQPPTQEQLARLEEVLRDPDAHFITPPGQAGRAAA